MNSSTGSQRTPWSSTATCSEQSSPCYEDARIGSRRAKLARICLPPRGGGARPKAERRGGKCTQKPLQSTDSRRKPPPLCFVASRLAVSPARGETKKRTLTPYPLILLRTTARSGLRYALKTWCCYPCANPIVTDSDPTGNAEVQPKQSKLIPARDLITGGFSKNADLISYVVTGLLLGLLFDWMFGTRPLMIILWTLLGVAVGYFALWKNSEELEEQGKARSHGA